MWPVKPKMKESSHMWLAKPAILQSEYKKKNQLKKKSVCDDKKSIYPVHSYVASNKIKLYAANDQAKLYVVTQTSNETIYLQEI